MIYIREWRKGTHYRRVGLVLPLGLDCQRGFENEKCAQFMGNSQSRVDRRV